MNRAKKASIGKLLRECRVYYKRHGRDLPWRESRDSYRILVSEVMLQQTQVERVVPFYTAFIKKFPTVRALARAPLAEVLRVWQGLGYNRRAKYLHEAAKIVARGGSAGQKLPGVGAYTAAAVAAFAHDQPTVFIETNIRTVFLYFCFARQRGKVADNKILPLVAEALRQSRMSPREFYWMLMDYGAYLKRQGIKLNARSAHYAKQSKFEGSARQARAARLRRLLARGASDKELSKALK